MATIEERLEKLWVEVVIGLETHVELNTKSKMFCACANEDTETPNIHICPLCTGQLGVLPLPNQEAIRKTVALGLAIGGEITPVVDRDRKHYEYPDLPKGYQITQLDHPIVVWGKVECYRLDGSTFTVEIDHIHLEEDTGKFLHSWDHSLLDFNRSGRALVEIVTKPCIRSIEDMGIYFEYLQKTVIAIDASFADMEKGHFRSDLSLSLRKKWTNDLNPRTEVKNMNSFKFSKDALNVELESQLAYREANGWPKQEQVTALRDTKEKQIKVMRNKENAQDYRYIKEPDIPAVDIRHIAASVKFDATILPFAIEHRVIEAWIHPKDSKFFSADTHKAKMLFTIADAVWDVNLTAKTLLNYFKEEDYIDEKVQPMIDVLSYYKKWDYSWGLLKKAMQQFMQTGSVEVEKVFVEEKIDESVIENAITEALQKHQDLVELIKNGDEWKVNMIVGSVMKQLGGKVRWDIVKEKILEKIV